MINLGVSKNFESNYVLWIVTIPTFNYNNLLKRGINGRLP